MTHTWPRLVMQKDVSQKALALPVLPHWQISKEEVFNSKALGNLSVVVKGVWT